MTPSELASVFTGLSTSQQVEFLAAIKPSAFFLADELANNPSEKDWDDVEQAIATLTTISEVMMEYALHYGTTRLIDCQYKGRVNVVFDDKGSVQGINLDGFFFEDVTAPTVGWRTVEVCHG